MTGDLHALRWQIEWGADEALETVPRDRRRTVAAAGVVPLPVAGPVTAAAYAGVEQVDTALRATGGAGLAITAQHFVGVRGRADAPVLVVGDCPGEAEERSGVAFSGEAGRLLATMLQSAGIALDDCGFGYMVPWRPPGGRAPTDAEIAVCAPFLLARLALRPPRVVLPCGAGVARALLGPTAGARSRGRLLPAQVAGPDPLACLVLQAPEQAMASPRGKAQAWLTMRLLRRTMKATGPE